MEQKKQFILFDENLGFNPTLTETAGANVEHREAYFNGSSYLRLLSPMPMWKHSAFSIRSCRGKV